MDTLIVMIRTDGPLFVQTASGGKDGVEQEVALFASRAQVLSGHSWPIM